MLEIAEILTLCSVAPGFQHTGGQLRKSPQKTSINSNFASALSVNCSQMLEAIVLTRYWNGIRNDSRYLSSCFTSCVQIWMITGDTHAKKPKEFYNIERS
jgi:hypothetical protein